MKLFLKLLIIVVIVAMAAPFFIKGSDGKPLISAGTFLPEAALPESMKALLQTAPLNTDTTTPHHNPNRNTNGENGETKVYRWQDAEGQWHYSDRAGQQNAEQHTIRQSNQLPAYQPKQVETTESALTLNRNSASEVKMPSSNLSGTLSLSDTEALMKQAQETQRILQERQAQIDALLKAQTQ